MTPEEERLITKLLEAVRYPGRKASTEKRAESDVTTQTINLLACSTTRVH